MHVRACGSRRVACQEGVVGSSRFRTCSEGRAHGTPPSGPGAPVSSHLMCFVAQLCPTLCNPMDCSPPGSSVHGILQMRILDGVPCPPPGDLPNPGIRPRSPALQADSFLSEPPPGNLLILALPNPAL